MNRTEYKIQKYTNRLRNTRDSEKKRIYSEKISQYKNQRGGVKEEHLLREVVPEFMNNTKEMYRNATQRTLNKITLFTRDGTAEDPENYGTLKTTILKNKDRIERTSQTEKFLTEFLEILKSETATSPQLIVQMEGFFAIISDYKKDMDSGTYVTENLFNEIFLEDKLPTAIKINNSLGKGFSASKGKGKQNLNTVARELKARGIKYMMLEAAGSSGLVNLYTLYGFGSILHNYTMYMSIGGRYEMVGVSENYIMVGLIDDIIEKTT